MNFRVVRDGREVPNEDLPAQVAAARGVEVRDDLMDLVFDDGEVRSVLGYATPILNDEGQPRGSVGVLVDVTAQKKLERELRAANLELAEADRRKDAFLSVLSHELRNPLTPIRNCLFILDRATPGGEQAKRAKAIINRQVAQLARLVDDLLDVTRISKGNIQLQRERVELGELLSRTVEDHRCLYVAAGVTLHSSLAEGPIWADADAARITEAVGNLLQNAVKFTPAGGEVNLSLAVDAVAGAPMAAIRVHDTGAGIPPHLLPRLFEPFTQADETLDRSQGGLGMGLAIVKGVVDLHGGRVEARSDGVDRGAEFTILLPLDAEAMVAESMAPRSRKVGVRRVLIIEDNVDAADSLRDLLALRGHEVEVAYDGLDGVSTASDFRPPGISSSATSASRAWTATASRGPARRPRPRRNRPRGGDRLLPPRGRAAGHRGRLRPSRRQTPDPREARAPPRNRRRRPVNRGPRRQPSPQPRREVRLARVIVGVQLRERLRGLDTPPLPEVHAEEKTITVALAWLRRRWTKRTVRR